MKILPLLLIVALSRMSSPALGQTCAAVSLEKMNVVYIGLDNPISVVVNDVAPEHLRLVPSFGVIKRDGACHYAWHAPKRQASEMRLAVLDTLRGDTVGLFHFRVKELPEPTALLGAQYHSRVLSAGNLRAQSGVAMVFLNYDIDIRFTMRSYDVCRISRGRVAAVLHNTGPRFTPAVQALLDQAQAGDRYIFRNFVYFWFGGEQRYSTQELVFKIK